MSNDSTINNSNSNNTAKIGGNEARSAADNKTSSGKSSGYSASGAMYNAIKEAEESSSKPRLFQKKLLPISFTLFLAFAMSILFFFVLFYFRDIDISLNKFFYALKPFIYGGVIAYILVPMCNAYERLIDRFFREVVKSEKGCKKNVKESLAIALSMCTFALIIYILLSLILPQLIISLTTISRNLTTYYKTINDWLHNTFKDNKVLLSYIDDFTGNLSDTLSNWIKTELLPNAKTIVSSVSSGVLGAVTVVKNLVIGIIVSIYLLKSRTTYAAQCKILVHSIFKEKKANKIIKEVRFTNKMFMGFISGRILDSAIIGILCSIGLTLMDMPYAFLISVIVGITNIIPFFGPFIGGIPSGLLILIVDPVKCIWFIIFIIVLQQFDGNILGPKILGEMTNLNSFWVLFSIIIFSGLFGFAGMIIGVPLFAVIYHLTQELVLKGLKRTGYTPTGEEAEVSNYNAFIEERNLENAHSADASESTHTPLFGSLISRIRTRGKKNSK